MNRFSQTALLLSLLGYFSQISAQQNPCLCIETESKPCLTSGAVESAVFQKNGSRSVLFTVETDPAPANDALDGFPGARYKAFWIFGDGNMAYFEHRDSANDVSTLTQPYTYRRDGKYKVEAALTEKKSNTKPPMRTVRELEIKNTTAGDGTDFFKRILSADNKTADLLPSDSMRPHSYRTAFAVSAPKDQANTGIYFFYNSMVTPSGSTIATMHEKVDVLFPDYATGTAFVEGLTLNLNNAIGDALERRYRNYLYVPVSPDQMANLPAEFDEYRFFPILKTIWTDQLPRCRFLAVVVGSSPVPSLRPQEADKRPVEHSDDATFFTDLKLETLQALVMEILGDNFSLDNPVFDTTRQDRYFLRGIYELEVPMVGSSDPNELEVVSICPLERGKYKVKMRVQVCNNGEIPEHEVPMRVIDHTNGEISDFKFLTHEDKLASTLQFDAASHTWHFTWPLGLPGVYTATDAANGAELPQAPYAPQCFEVYFEVVASLSGAQKLVAGQGLEACATFPAASIQGFPDECHYNFDLEASLFSPESGYACGPPPVTVFSCGFLCILLILILLAILIWWFLKKDD